MINKIRELMISTRKFGDDFADLFKPKNSVEIIIKKAATGEVVKTIKGRNIVTGFLGSSHMSGKDVMRRLLIDPDSAGTAQDKTTVTTAHTYVRWMEFGTGTVAERSSDTALANPVVSTYADARQAVSSTVTLSTTGTPTAMWSATWTTAMLNGLNLSEAALLVNNPGSSTPHFIARKTFTPFEKTAEFEIELRWTLRF